MSDVDWLKMYLYVFVCNFSLLVMGKTCLPLFHLPIVIRSGCLLISLSALHAHCLYPFMRERSSYTHLVCIASISSKYLSLAIVEHFKSVASLKTDDGAGCKTFDRKVYDVSRPLEK